MQKPILLLLITLIITVGGAYIFLSPKKSFEAPNAGEPSQSIPENWPEYINKVRNFSLRYPPELIVQEYDEGEGTYTVVFEDMDSKGFQIFFTPYPSDTIAKSRILKDVPSGQFTEPVEIVVAGGINALAFLSEGLLGQMREIWFLHNGYLYEITTYAHLDSWLAQILSTWRFG